MKKDTKLYVTTDNIGEFIKHNLSGRASQKKFTVKTLVDELKKYNHKDGGKNRQWAVENLDSEKIAQKYIDLWQEKSLKGTKIEIINSLNEKENTKSKTR